MTKDNRVRLFKKTDRAYCMLVSQHTPEEKNTRVTVSRNAYPERRLLLSQYMSEALPLYLAI